MEEKETKTAYITKKEGKTVIQIENLTIDLVEEPNGGPLKFGKGYSSGIIIWENEYFKKDDEEGHVTFGGGPLKAHAKIDRQKMEAVRDLI